jgi:hypothetical protein
MATTVGGYGQHGGTESSVTKNAGNLNAFGPTLRSERLEFSEGIKYEGTGRKMFRIEIPALRTPPRPKPPPLPATKSSPPTVRLMYFGFASTAGDAKRIFLSEEGDVFVAREGDIINRRYKILHITPTAWKWKTLSTMFGRRFYWTKDEEQNARRRWLP